MGRLTISGFQVPGLIKDVGEYTTVPEAFNEVRNFRFNPRGAVAVAGHQAVMSAAPFDPIWLKMFPPLEAPSWVYANATKVGVFQDGHYDITRLSGDYATPPQERWAGDVFNGVGIFNNTFDKPQQWLNFSGATPLEDLSNWPSTLRCKFIRPFKQFLIAGNLTDAGVRRPQRLRWSHPADPGSVPASWVINDPAIDAGEIDIAESADELIDAYTLGDQFIVYKQKSVHQMQLGGPDIFTRRELFATKGLLTRDCVQSIPIGHFVVGVDDIYVHSGQRGTDQSIVDNRLRDWIFNQISKDNYFYCYTLSWRRLNEIWFCFPEAGETYPTLAMIYNTVTHGIGVKDIPRVPFMYPGPVVKQTDSPTWGGGEYVAPDNYEYTNAGTYELVIDPLAQYDVVVVGGGGGGECGTRAAAGEGFHGGQGGGGGGHSIASYAPGVLSGTVTIVVGAAGVGGVAVSAVDTAPGTNPGFNRVAGTAGGDSSFGALVSTGGAGGDFLNVQADAGTGNTGTAGDGNSGGNHAGDVNGEAGGTGTNAPGGGGGGGAGNQAGPTAGNGGSGGGIDATPGPAGGAGHTTDGLPGVSGSIVGNLGTGGSGGGGCEIINDHGNGGNGGAGVRGSGGGGGGCARTYGLGIAVKAGNGGNGGQGYVKVEISYPP